MYFSWVGEKERKKRFWISRLSAREEEKPGGWRVFGFEVLGYYYLFIFDETFLY